MRKGDRPLSILSIAYPLLPVGPGSAGGAEQILHLIDRGLVQAGHRSVVIAARGSKTTGKLIGTPTLNREINDESRAESQQHHRNVIELAISEHEFDLIHFHGLDFHTYCPEQNHTPQLATLHLPLTWYPSLVFERPDLCLNCVSQSQAESAAPERALPVVLNGIDVGGYRVSTTKQNYLLWLGRICPEKGVHIALRVAQSLKVPMIIAGPIHPFEAHQTYYREKVKPLLNDQLRYVGPVGMEAKTTLLANARCLLVPSLVAETSSLVAMEAISSGTPVIALRSGALPEIVDHGRTGFIVDSEDEMTAAVIESEKISPRVCRSVAENRFEASRMVNDYVELYRRTIFASCARA